MLKSYMSKTTLFVSLLGSSIRCFFAFVVCPRIFLTTLVAHGHICRAFSVFSTMSIGHPLCFVSSALHLCISFSTRFTVCFLIFMLPWCYLVNSLRLPHMHAARLSAVHVYDFWKSNVGPWHILLWALHLLSLVLIYHEIVHLFRFDYYMSQPFCGIQKHNGLLFL